MPHIMYVCIIMYETIYENMHLNARKNEQRIHMNIN